MPVVSETLRDAQTLAEFSNLEPSGVEYFRNNYPDFVAQAWWDYQTEPNRKQWQMTQEFVRDAWERRFTGGLFFMMRIVLSVFDPTTLFDVIWGFDKTIPGLERPAFASMGDLPYGNSPFQNAVLYIFENPWRARFCAECNKRFVAAEPKNKYCSEACSHEKRNRQKRASWAKHGRQWRKPKGRATRATTGKGIRRRRKQH